MSISVFVVDFLSLYLAEIFPKIAPQYVCLLKLIILIVTDKDCVFI